MNLDFIITGSGWDVLHAASCLYVLWCPRKPLYNCSKRVAYRTETLRGGKECRSRWSQNH